MTSVVKPRVHRLKIRLVRAGLQQQAVARQAGMSETRLSRLLRYWDQPREGEMERIEVAIRTLSASVPA